MCLNCVKIRARAIRRLCLCERIHAAKERAVVCILPRTLDTLFVFVEERVISHWALLVNNI